MIPTLDASSVVVKSDVLFVADLKARLQEAFQQLKREQESAPDWHPGSNEKVMDLVHPSLYPLVYGRTKVIKSEDIGVDYAVSFWN